MPDSLPRRNVELKARCRDLDEVRKKVVELGARNAGILEQRDTYFHVPSGRLKLRQTVGEPAYLIGYDRPNFAGNRTSRFRLIEIPDADGLLAALTAALGVRAIVVKRRELFLNGNVRIHLDRVEGLGDFVEFEAMLGPNDTECDGDRRLKQLQRTLRLADEDLIAGSYGEME